MDSSFPLPPLLPAPKDFLLAVLLSLPIIFLLLLLLLLRLRRDGPLPVEWPVLGMLPSAVYNLHRLHDFSVDLLRLSNTATAFVRGPFLSADMLVTANPANIRHIFMSNFPNYPKGPEYSEIFSDVLGNGIFNSDHESWKLQRKLAHSLMARPSFSTLVTQTSNLKLHHGILSILSHVSKSRKPLDLQDIFLRFTFDTTCIIVMGVDPGCLSLDSNVPVVPFAKAIDDAEEVILLRHIWPIFCWKVFRWLGLGEEGRLKTASVVIQEYIRAEVTKRKNFLLKPSEPSEPSDLLSSYLQVDSNVGSGYFDPSSFEFLRDTMVSLLIAGRDTTASGLAWFFYLVSTHPDVEERVVRELDGARRTIGSDGFAIFEVDSLLSLVYLHATVLETLRLYPPLPFEHKTALEGDELPSGRRVEKGTRVFVSLYAISRMEGVWGEDCKEFKPERWINDKGKIRYEPSYKFMAFNSGPRTCLGKDMALSQMKVAAAAILWNFEVEVVNVEEVLPRVSILLHMRNGLKVRVRRRKTQGETLTVGSS